ncbi:MAG: DNA adenine methylase, partial [Nevskiaceae bacterium]
MPFESSLGAVEPVAPYVGGKRNLAKEITKRIAKIPHR